MKYMAIEEYNRIIEKFNNANRKMEEKELRKKKLEKLTKNKIMKTKTRILPFRMDVTSEQSKIVQEILFENGYTWAGGTQEITRLDRRCIIFEIFDNNAKPQLRVTGESDEDEPLITFEQFINKYKINPERKEKLEKLTKRNEIYKNI